MKGIKNLKDRDIAVELLKRADSKLVVGGGLNYVCIRLNNEINTRTEARVSAILTREISRRIAPSVTVSCWLNTVHHISWSKLTDNKTLLYRKRWVKSMITELNEMTF